MSEPNLVKYMSRFNQKEKAVLLRMIKLQAGEEHHHEGTLPFISIATAAAAIRSAAIGYRLAGQHPATLRICREILSKLDSKPDGYHGNSIFFMRLNNKKVHRQFGAHPEKGKPLNFLPKERVTVGVKFSLPKKCWVPDDNVLVAPSVALIKQRGELWEVTVKESCRDRVKAWLQQTCA